MRLTPGFYHYRSPVITYSTYGCTLWSGNPSEEVNVRSRSVPTPASRDPEDTMLYSPECHCQPIGSTADRAQCQCQSTAYGVDLLKYRSWSGSPVHPTINCHRVGSLTSTLKHSLPTTTPSHLSRRPVSYTRTSYHTPVICSGTQPVGWLGQSS